MELRNFREKTAHAGPARPPSSRDLIANYYGMISLIDHNVGRMLEALDAYGLADNTLVVYSTDHGDWLGDHGLILKGPMAYEGLLRVGLLVRGPGVAEAVVHLLRIVDEVVELARAGVASRASACGVLVRTVRSHRSTPQREARRSHSL